MKRKQISLMAGAAICTLTVLFTILYAAFSGAFTEAADDYIPPTDIEGYAKEAILAVTEAGLMKTRNDGNTVYFDPARPVTRGEVAQALALLLSLPTETYEDLTLGFADEQTITPASLPAVRAVLAAGHMKLKNDRTFGEADIVTREEAADIAASCLLGEISAGKSERFEDIDKTGDYFLKGVKKTVDYDIMIGYPDGTFRPADPLTKEEFALILHRLLQNEHLLQRKS